MNPIGEAQYDRLEDMGFDDLDRIYELDDLAADEDILFACTGVTDGDFLDGVRYDGKRILTHSMVLRSARGTRRVIRGHHRADEFFTGDEDDPPLLRRAPHGRRSV